MRFLQAELPPTKLRLCFAILIATVIVAGCNRTPSGAVVEPLPEAGNDWPTRGWITAAPESQGMDSNVLAAMLESIDRQGYGTDSVTVIRNGYLLVDAAVYPYDQTTKHIVHSCTKSIVSILIGIAIDQGHIDDVQVPISSLFPDRTFDNNDANKEAMTLEDLLTMSSGLRCRDSYLYRWSGLNEMLASEDWVQFMLDLPMAEPPGTRFEYCNGASFLLSAIISEVTGMSALEFAEANLFGPLGISDVVWPANPQGISIGWGELRILPHDLAKIGYLYLHEGQWEGEQIVSSSWVEASTRKHIPATLQDGYGYQWWIDDSGMYLALGYGGQFAYVLPEERLVAVFTSDNDDDDFYVPQALLNDYILPAILSEESLPSDPEAEALLQFQTEQLAKP
jgi:CubicO group peptidase (beta-lactamase class C family)